MNNSKVAVAVNKTISIVQMLAGIALIFVFGICTIVYVSDKEFAADSGVIFLLVCLAFDALGVWLIILSRKKAKLIRDFKKYVAAISHDPNGYIPDIADSLGLSEDAVKNNLELMIKKQFFSNAFIDRNSNCIVISNKQSASNEDASPNVFSNLSAVAANAANPAAEMVTVKCKGCGGINTIPKGAVGECDYCGCAIKGQ